MSGTAVSSTRAFMLSANVGREAPALTDIAAVADDAASEVVQ